MADHPIFAADMQEIVESFVIETREIFETLDTDLLQLESRSTDRALVDQIFRAVHTVKGTSGFLSLEQLSVLAHHFEDVLNKLRREDLVFHSSMMDVMLQAFDLMKELLEQVVANNIVHIDLDGVIADLNAISDGTFVTTEAKFDDAPAVTKETPETTSVADAISEVAPEQPTPVEESVTEAEALAAIQAVFGQAPAPAETDADAAISEALAGAPDQDTSAVTDTEPEAEPATNASSTDEIVEAPTRSSETETTAKAKQEMNTETIRVEVGRLDNLMNLVGELVLGRNRLLQVVADGSEGKDFENLIRDLADTSSQVDFITTELQSAIMRTRMVQIGRVFNKFPRLVRDLSREFGKKIDLVIEGEETELDKSLIEEIGDPLIHLIRNAADHGVETPGVRQAAGKSANGTIHLTAAHEGNHIVIEIVDDGAGMDPERLKQAAVDKGIITRKEAAEMNDADSYGLIFRAGFSTAKKVSQVSGRGVGMDVVKTNITRLNGTVSIDSQLGRGTRFTLKLPLTLAIIQSLLVKVGEETYAVPLHSVIEVVSLESHEVNTIRGREIIRLRDQVLPLLRVGDAMNVTSSLETRNAYAVIVGISHLKLGLVVDDLIGQKEIVIKPLGDYLKKVAGIAGSTILGDGRVIMIIDVAEVVRMETEKLHHEPVSVF